MKPPLRVDREKHEYWVGQIRKPSVTDILGAVGAKGPDGEWHSISGAEEYTRFAPDPIHRAIGRELHALAAAWSLGNDADYDPMLEPWAKYLRPYIDNEVPMLLTGPTKIDRMAEQALFNERAGYAQSADLTLLRTEQKQIAPGTGLKWLAQDAVVIDWKFTSSPTWHPSWLIQVAAYAATVREVFSLIKWPRAWVVNVSKDGIAPRSIAGPDTRENYNTFLSALNVYKQINPTRKEEQNDGEREARGAE